MLTDAFQDIRGGEVRGYDLVCRSDIGRSAGGNPADFGMVCDNDNMIAHA
jgi:hypothetical protein